MTDQPKKAKSFFIKLLIACAGIVIADKGIGGLMHHFYGRIRHGEQGRLTYTIDSASQSMLIIGSSRAAHHYVSPIVSNELHLSCYNAGKDKQGLFYYLAILKMVLRRYRPNDIILDLSPVSFASGEASLDQLSVLLPYYRQHPEIRGIVDKRSPWEWLKTYSSLYCYNSLALQIAFNNLSDERDAGVIYGYIPKYNTLDHPSFPPFTLQQECGLPDSAIVEAFEQIIALTKQNGCRLVVVFSPFFLPMPDDESTIQLAKKICCLRKIPFLDYTRSVSFIGNASLFGDEQHMNNTGAEIFTHILCRDLTALGFRQQQE